LIEDIDHIESEIANERESANILRKSLKKSKRKSDSRTKRNR
jgi:hypothetical protein